MRRDFCALLGKPGYILWGGARLDDGEVLFKAACELCHFARLIAPPALSIVSRKARVKMNSLPLALALREPNAK